VRFLLMKWRGCCGEALPSPFLRFHHAGGKLGRGKVRSKGKETAGAGPALTIYGLWSAQAASMCQFFRAGGHEGRPHPPSPVPGAFE
jgi:hypothetical protein